MVRVFNNGLMVPNTKVNGVTIEHMVKGNSLILMVMYTMANGAMIKPMASVLIIMSTELAMKASGKMISSMDMARKLGQMDPTMKGILLRI